MQTLKLNLLHATDVFPAMIVFHGTNYELEKKFGHLLAVLFEIKLGLWNTHIYFMAGQIGP